LDCAGTFLGVRILIGDDRDFTPDQRQHHGLAHHVFIARVVGVHATAVSPNIVSGRVVATTMKRVGSAFSGYLKCHRYPLTSTMSPSRSELAFWNSGSQLTRRLSL